MANVKLPDPLARRHLLEGKIDAAKARAIGEAYLAAERELEAIDFLARGDAGGVLASLQAVALERGDVFLFRAAAGAAGATIEASTWSQLAEVASAAGRERDAETAKRLATVGD
ncbi:MAG: hypothetical protein NXI30_21205 [bacterium]|nr:hypothetical protein [bacterium]